MFIIYNLVPGGFRIIEPGYWVRIFLIYLYIDNNIIINYLFIIKLVGNLVGSGFPDGY